MYRILYLIKSSETGGTQEHVLSLIQHLDRSRFDVSVATGSEGPLNEALEKLGVKVYRLPQVARYEVSFLHDLMAAVRIFRLLRREKFQLLHAHNSKPGVWGRIMGKLARVPVIIFTPHNFSFQSFTNSWLYPWLLRLERWLGTHCCDKVILVSETMRKKAIEEGWLPAQQLVAIPNGIDPVRLQCPIRAAQAKQELGIPPDAPLIGCIARFSPQKDPLNFIQAAYRVLQAHPEAHLLMVGGGPLQPKMEEACEDLHIQDRVHFLGPRKDIPCILAALDVFVLASLWEGLSLTLLEAMMVGKPVVVSDVPGNLELVTADVEGLVVPTHSPQLLAEAIVDLLDDPDKAAALAQAAQRKVSEHYSIARMVEKTQQLYLDCLKARGL